MAEHGGGLDRQVSEHLRRVLSRIAQLAHDCYDEQLRGPDSIRRSVDKLLLNGGPLERVARSSRFGQRLEVQVMHPPLASGQLRFGLELAVVLVGEPVVLGAEALPESPSA